METQDQLRDADRRALGPPPDGGRTAAPPAANAKPAARPLIVDGPGSPLPEGERRRFERRLGGDLSAVRLHSGPESRALAGDLAARAFALGDHVVLGDPALARAHGARVLAHELAHTLQPRESPPRIHRTTEEQRAAGTVPQGILTGSGFDAKVAALRTALAAASSLSAARTAVENAGQGLWNDAVARARGSTPNTDDRPLYWARLSMTALLRSWSPSFTLSAADRTALIDAFEARSRGRESVSFAGVAAAVKKVLVSGFDPFGFGNQGSIRQANPSGAAALALDGATITGGGRSARVESVIFPVRFDDFDANVVENTFRPFLSAGPRRVDMIVTISQGGQQLGTSSKLPEFELERFAGRRRSSGSFQDNVGRTQGTPQRPVEGGNLAAGAEFLGSTLPRSQVHSALGRSETVHEREFTEIPSGGQPTRRTSGSPASGSTAVAGSGGGFLSNEVFYRTALLASTADKRRPVPVGHLHVPVLTPPDGTAADETRHTKDRDAIIKGVKTIIGHALPHI